MTPRLLVVRLGSLGDIVHALPAVSSLRAAWPQARLDWLVEARWQELIELNPDISNVIPVDTRGWRRALLRPSTWRSLTGLQETLRRANYEAAIDFQGLYKSALLARLSRAPRRLGFAKGFLKEAGAARFYTEPVRPPENTHVIEMNLAVARAAGARESPAQFPLPTTGEDEAAVEQMLATHRLRDFVILSPGGGWGSKCWPVERYALVHNSLARERGWRTVVNAGPGEESLASEFMVRARVTRPVHLTLSLRQLVALTRRARLLISGDTGPLHLAAALGTPVVGLYGPTDPVRNGPYSPRAVVLHHREQATITYKHEDKPSPALLAITVEEVIAAVNRCLEGSGG
jgi:lipopolysaccharide heptosyltransferase I